MKILGVLVFGLISAMIGGGMMWLNATSLSPDSVDTFHRAYYDNSLRTWNGNTHWFGVETEKMPLDMWVFQEIIYETKPDVLVEAGTFKGGSAFYYATLFDALNKGRVITIDIEKRPNLPVHPRITYLLGSSTSDEIVNQVKSSIKPGERVMVVLDSDHSEKHVSGELRAYSGLVTVGNYLVVEDSNINGHPVLPTFGPGPMEALLPFVKAHPEFVIDHDREKFGLTFNPNGWLKRVK